MSKKEEKNQNGGTGTNGASAIPEVGTRLGKRRSQWKPGIRPLRGVLFGISGQRFRDGSVKETLIVKVDPKFPTIVSAWDAVSKTGTERESQPGEEIFLYFYPGLESLRGYASDPNSVYDVYIPKGEKIKIQGGKSFWAYVKDNPDDKDTLTLSGTKYRRTEAMRVEQVVGRAVVSPDDDDTPAVHAEGEEYGDDLPF